MIEFSIKVNKNEIQRVSQDFKRIRRGSLPKIGFDLVTQAENQIKSSGGGSWPLGHPISLNFGKPNKIWVTRNKRSPFFNLGEFSKFQIFGDTVITGFGSFGKAFKPNLMAIAKKMAGGSIQVSKKMRKKFGATRPSLHAKIGKDYFPLRKTTTILQIPKRPIKFNLNRSIEFLLNYVRRSYD